MGWTPPTASMCQSGKPTSCTCQSLPACVKITLSVAVLFIYNTEAYCERIVDSFILLPHILAGSIALLSGAAALYFRKGSIRHVQAGTVFTVAILAMAGTGALMAAMTWEAETAVVAVLAMYLVATSWVTARHRDGRAGRFELYALAIPVGCFVALLALGFDAVRNPREEVPPIGLFVFAALAALPAALDISFLLRRRLTGPQRIGRHLWRMCAALLLSVFSFFQGQVDVFPDVVRGSFILSLPTLGTLVLMLYWVLRIRFGKALKILRATGGAASRPAEHVA
jgi:hypothetical protein